MTSEGDERTAAPQGLGDPTRMLALSDGVFSIIMTLLVLDLQVPKHLVEGDLRQHLMGGLPTLVAYVFGFLLAGVYWIGHRDLFVRVRAITSTVLWLNIVFLMVASLIPFGANLLGNYPTSPTVLALYGTLLASLAAARLALYRYVTGRADLLVVPLSPVLRAQVTQVMGGAVAAFMLCVAVGSVVPPVVVVAVYGCTPVLFVSTVTWISRQWAKSPAPSA